MLNKLALYTYMYMYVLSQNVYVKELGYGSSMEGGDFVVDFVPGWMWLSGALFICGVEDCNGFFEV